MEFGICNISLIWSDPFPQIYGPRFKGGAVRGEGGLSAW